MNSPTMTAIRSTLIPEVNWPSHARGWTELAIAVVFGVCLPLFLILGNVEYITKSDWLYTYNWWRNDIPDRSGLPESELDSGADQIKDYFTNDEEFLDLRVNYQGREVSLYNEREVLHMKDVKGLMQAVFLITRITGGIALLIAISGLFYYRSGFWRKAMQTLRWSALGSGALVAVFSIAVIINFDWVFTQFHFLSFANDLWMLNPRTDYLLIMFPQRFFFEATVIIAVLSVLQFALLMYAVSLLRKGYGSARSDDVTGLQSANR